MHGLVRTVWVHARDGVEMDGEKARWAAVDARTCVDGVGAREKVEMVGWKARWASASMDAQTCADVRRRAYGIWTQGKWWKWIAPPLFPVAKSATVTTDSVF